MIAYRQAAHSRPNLAHNARSLMAQYRRKNTFGVATRKRKGIGVTDTGGHYLNQDLSGAWALKVYGFNA